MTFSLGDKSSVNDDHMLCTDNELPSDESIVLVVDNNVDKELPDLVSRLKDVEINNDQETNDNAASESYEKEESFTHLERPADIESIASTSDSYTKKVETERSATSISKAKTPSKKTKVLELIDATEMSNSFDTMAAYFKQLSLNLFYEEVLENPKFLNHREFEVEIDLDLDEKRYTFSVMSNKVVHLIPPNVRRMTNSPFSMNQAIYLYNTINEPLIGYVNGIGKSNVRNTANVLISVSIVLYKWSSKELIKDSDLSTAKMILGSLPISRSLTAMNRISNSNLTLIEHLAIGDTSFDYFKYSETESNYDPAFNKAQNSAIDNVLDNKISFVEGPPGTGKTSVIVSLIKKLMNSSIIDPILVVAASNTAIDNIAEQFIGTVYEKLFLRLVSLELEEDYDEDHVLGPMCLHNRVFNRLLPKYEDILMLMKHELYNLQMFQTWGKYKQARFKAQRDLISKAKVIFTTTVSAGSPLLKGCRFSILVMDEATQSSEPATLIPLSLRGLQQVAFVGDPKQLGCYATNPKLSLSLFERLLQSKRCPEVSFLDTQYRMHPDISEFPRSNFYNEKLKDGISVEKRKLPNIKRPLIFWDTNGICEEKLVKDAYGFGDSFQNMGEARRVAHIIEELIEVKHVQRKNIGVVIPYGGQRDLVTTILSDNIVINPSKQKKKANRDQEDLVKQLTVHYVAGIMIAPIDAFQGKEKDIIVMSCVRSNSKNKIGYVRDERRLNVSLTRAKYCSIIVGDANCLREGSTLWAKFLKFLSEKGAISQNLDL